jgi:myo-inositol 2-dehydrogenase / D-chiro-inositol 1-dehydrogenase
MEHAQLHLRYGIIGCGMMGREHLRNIALLSGAEVEAIFEPDEAMRQAARQLAPGAVFTESLEALLDRDRVNCLLIASPNHCHLAQLETIAAIRPLPVLVEKPLFTAPGDIDRLRTLRASYPQLLWVAMEYRYMPAVARFLEMAPDVTGGITMVSIREHRYPFLDKVGAWNRFNRLTGGTMVEKCCHFFDLMRLMAASDPRRVLASGGQAHNHLDERYNDRMPDIWDHGYAIAEFESGLRAMLELCMFAEGARYQDEITAVGPRGRIECHLPGPGRFWPQGLGDPPVARLIVSPRRPGGTRVIEIPVDQELLSAGDHNGATYFQHLKFQRAVSGLQPVEVTIDDGWWAVAMGMAAQQSSASGRAVDFPSAASPPRDFSATAKVRGA